MGWIRTKLREPQPQPQGAPDVGRYQRPNHSGLEFSAAQAHNCAGNELEH
jgi:hypothetical protein